MQQNRKIIPVILCGGSGSRLSLNNKNNTPKQFIKLVDDKSLIRATVDRLLEISDADQIILVTSNKYKELDTLVMS